ncbi:MAG: formate--tetrahydrofolate ligase, partial [Stellaceae bacterium]
LEGNPAFIHGGPFANIAHGCNSVSATMAGLKLADYTVTEAGFGADLGAEKFMNIKCRKAGISPDCAVIVATIRALKMHGGVAKDDLKHENVEAVRKGFANLERHLENVKKFGVPAVVSVNRFSTDTKAEHELVKQLCAAEGVEAVIADHWATGGAGSEELGRVVLKTLETKPAHFKMLYPDDMPLLDKVKTIARELYHAKEVVAEAGVTARIKEFEAAGYGNLPVCMAKTQYSFSTDVNARGAASGFTLPIREVRLSAGAEFVVVICGEIMTMPGLPRVPSANNITVTPEGRITGLF